VPLMGGRLSFAVANGRCTVLSAPEGLEVVPTPIAPTA
jgi:hypothetical protein